jgi:4-hydroxy-tetrahydrodipicolinate synthase
LITPFAKNGAIDDDELRRHALRLAASDIGICIANSSLGEGFTLSPDEIRHLYEVVVAACGGRVPVYANPPEQHDPRQAVRHAQIAAEAGCDAVVLYPVAGWHGFRPNEAEAAAFLDAILGGAPLPVLIAANPILGYVPQPGMIARAIERHSQVVGVTINGDERYLLSLRSGVSREIDYYCQLNGFVSAWAGGATGLFAYEANVLPRTFADFIAACAAWDADRIRLIGQRLLAFRQIIERWGPGHVKVLKMVMQLLQLPGGTGICRPPNIMPEPGWEPALAADLRSIGLPELDQLLSDAGLAG